MAGTVHVAFRVMSDGKVMDARIIRSSGHALLDNAAIDAVARLKQFDAFPPDINKTVWEFEMPIRFQPSWIKQTQLTFPFIVIKIMLSAEYTQSIIDHMNDDHADAVLAYVQAYTAHVSASQASLKAVDVAGMDVEFTVDGHTKVRPVLIKMVKRAREIIAKSWKIWIAAEIAWVLDVESDEPSRNCQYHFASWFT